MKRIADFLIKPITVPFWVWIAALISALTLLARGIREFDLSAAVGIAIAVVLVVAFELYQSRSSTGSQP